MNNPKILVYGMTLRCPTTDVVLWLNGERSNSRGHKVQKKHIEGDRVAGVSLHSIDYTLSAVSLILETYTGTG